MDWKEFGAALTEALAWPVALVLVIALLRKEIRQLIPSLRELEYKDFRLRFGSEVEELSLELQASTATAPVEALRPEESETSQIIQLSQISPRAAVLEAWRQVEEELVRIAAARGIQKSPQAMIPAAVSALEEKGIVVPNAQASIERARRLRNDAAHAPDFALSPVDAREYATLTTVIKELLRKAVE